MRILYLNHNVTGGGTYQRVIRIAAEVAAQGHDATVVTTSRRRTLRGAELVQHGVRVIEAPDLLSGGARQGWDAWNTFWRIARLAREEFDLIHGFDCRPAVIGPALAVRRLTGAPLILDWADWWGRGGTIQVRSGWAVRTFFGPIETWFEEAFRPGATAHTAISEPLRARCIGLGVPGERVLTLPNGCIPPDPATEDRDAARVRLGVAAEEPLLLHLGNIQPADAALLFDTFRLVRRTVPSARLALVGFPGSIPDDMNESGVITTGFLTGELLRLWLTAADVGVIPLNDNVANRARWPSKINDYLSAGLPVAMTSVGTAAGYVTRHAAGAVAFPGAEALSEAIVSLIGAPDAEAARTAARRLAAGELAWTPIVGRLLDFYDRSIAAGGVRVTVGDGRFPEAAAP